MAPTETVAGLRDHVHLVLAHNGARACFGIKLLLAGVVLEDDLQTVKEAGLSEGAELSVVAVSARKYSQN